MARAVPHPRRRGLLGLLVGTVVAVALIACLYWAQKIVIPVVLAVFLTFLLSPLVTQIQRTGMRRGPAVLVVVLLAGLLMALVVWVISHETGRLAGELPAYTENIKRKLDYLQQAGEGSVTSRVGEFLREISEDLKKRFGTPEGAGKGPAPPRGETRVVVEPGSSWWSQVPGVVASALEFLAQSALVVVLVVFMLIRREDLRDRLIWLLGYNRITITTKALDDAGQRISRYLLVQFVVNSMFGLVIGLGLLLIGVRHAILWAFLAAMFRYVPYLGVPVAAIFPVVVSLGMPGWWQPLLVMALFFALELFTGNVIEPLLYGRSIGASEVAQLVAAGFWTFLWGPLGLVLSAPVSVCLIVLGKYVPQLEFLAVVLGDEPALAPDISYYQRLVARNEEEATEQVLAHAAEKTPEAVYDDLLVPALVYARRDRARDRLTDEDELYIAQETREVLEHVGEGAEILSAGEKEKAPEEGGAGTGVRTPVRILGCPARDEFDVLALEMLRQALDPARWEMKVVSVEKLAAEVTAQASEWQPAVLCISSLPPGGLAQARYLCKRLRAQCPDVKLVVGRWGLKRNVEENRRRLDSAGADYVDTTVLGVRNHLQGWLPVLDEGASAEGQGPGAGKAGRATQVTSQSQ
jgi:predicted PurR-regulated permease PerM